VNRLGRDTRLIWGVTLGQTIGWGTLFSAFHRAATQR
jgi:hypothetical protein